MSTFPVTIRRTTYASASEIATGLKKRAVGGIRDNPGQMWPSEHYMNQGDAADAAIYEALDLLVNDEHPEVVRLVAHLALGHPDAAFWGALVDRLAGRCSPLPPVLANEVGRLLVDPVATHPSLLDKGLAAYASSGMPDYTFRVRMQVGSTSDRVSTFALATAAGRMDAGLAKRAGRVLARKDGVDAVLAGAAALFNADENVRAAFHAGAVRGDENWAHRDDLRQALRLPA